MNGGLIPLLLVLVAMAPVASAEWRPEAIIDVEPDPPIYAGVSVTLSAEYSARINERSNITWKVNGVPVPHKLAFIRSFDEGDTIVNLTIVNEDGKKDTVSIEFYVRPNPVPDLNGSITYYDPYEDETKVSVKKITVPLHASFEVFFEDLNDRKKDDLVFFTLTCSEGLEIADQRIRSREGTATLFAWSEGDGLVNVTAEDEAGQKDYFEFEVTVTGEEEPEVELDPGDSVDEGEKITILVTHPCSPEVCEYLIIIRNDDTGEEEEYFGKKVGRTFRDDGPYTMTCNVSYNESLLGSHQKAIWVNNTEDDPPEILWIKMTPEVVYPGDNVTFLIRIWDDDASLETLWVYAEVSGDYIDESRNPVEIVHFNATGLGSFTNSSLIPGRHEVTVNFPFDVEGARKETFQFRVLKPEPEQEEGIGGIEEEKENQSKETQETGIPFWLPVCMLFLAVCLYRLRTNRRSSAGKDDDTPLNGSS